MELTIHPSAAAFLSSAEGPLLREEALHNLILGIAAQVRDGHAFGDEAPYFLTVGLGRELFAAAIRTPPFPLILASPGGHRGAIEALVDHLATADPHLPGVNGPLPAATAFTDLWQKRRAVRAHIAMRTRIYELWSVVPPAGVPGTMRPAREEDLPLLADWASAFHAEAAPHDPPPDPQAMVERLRESGTLVVWDHQGPVSMAGSSRRSARGATVSLVYTPPVCRGRGYASACVAALSQLLLDRGCAFCTLYTDLANPTSNEIYRRIGYRPLADCAVYRFEPEPRGEPLAPPRR